MAEMHHQPARAVPGSGERVLNFIAGRWVSEGSTERPVSEPAHRAHVLWHAASASVEEAGRAVDAMGAAFPAWRRTPASARADVLLAAAASLQGRADQVARDISQEQGKTLAEATAEVNASVSSLKYFAGHALEPSGEVLPRSGRADLIWAQRVPVGPSLLITPWNFPLLIPAYKVAAALAFGNTAILKPSSLTPRAAAHLVEAFEEAGTPAGVLNLCLGEGERLMDALARVDAIGAVSFTGSAAVGGTIARRLAGTPVRLQLEMGGKNPLLVLDDADPELAARIAVDGAMGMAGQRCTATSRAIVVDRIHDAFVDALARRVAQIHLGDPLDPATAMGPLVSVARRDSVAIAVGEAVEAGAQLLCGGRIPPETALQDGSFFQPTVLAEVSPSSSIAQTEVFGPVLAVIRAADTDQAIELANATPFGLTASVVTRDLRRVIDVIDRLHAGVVHVNRPMFALERYVPFGGVKASGAGGGEQGLAAREFFTEWQAIYVSTDWPPTDA